MGNICQSCGAEMIGSKCGYCGFREIIDMDESGTDLLRTMVESHKKKLAESITDISVVTYAYRWNQEKYGLEQVKKEMTRLADGKDCYPNVHWTAQPFGQVNAGQNLKIELSYKVCGKQKQLICEIPAAVCNDFWKIGLLIDETLHLQVYLGTRENSTASSPLALELQ